MTLEQLRQRFIADAQRERNDTWGNTQDREAWQAIHRERARVFESCAAGLADVIADELKRAAAPRATAYWDVLVDCCCEVRVWGPTVYDALSGARELVSDTLQKYDPIRVCYAIPRLKP
jgi:hypothetical protein